MSGNRDHFELRRQSDNLVYPFDRAVRSNGTIGHKRRYPPEGEWVSKKDDKSYVDVLVYYAG